MRGEASMADITHDFSLEKDIYGSRLPRPSALAKVCGLADYGDDIRMKMPEGMLHLAVVISEVPHANIISIDTEEAEKMPGVVKVMTAKDVKGSNNMEGPPVVPRVRGRGVTEFPVIAGKKICRRGDCAALIAADTEEHARAAAKKVKVNLEILPSYMTFPEAVMPNAIQLHETLPNFFMEQPVYKGEDTAEIFERDDLIIAEGSFHSQHEPHLPIEPDVVQGYIGADGMITIQCKAQAITEAREGISMACGIPMDQLASS
jgi:aldehyde oxidoreductase